MSFPSILFRQHADRVAVGKHDQRSIFVDLGLDQIVSAIIFNKQEYNLAEYFNAPLDNPDAITYRQLAIQDIEQANLLPKLDHFARRMHSMRERLANLEKWRNPAQRTCWFLDIIFGYCQTITDLNRDLQAVEFRSDAFLAMRAHVADYEASDKFSAMATQAMALSDRLGAIRYTIHIDGLSVTVNPSGNEADYGAEVKSAFSNFDTGPTKNYPFERDMSSDVDNVEARILNKVIDLNPELFGELIDFTDANQVFTDPGVEVFDREVQFYISYLAYITPLRKAGLTFSYPLMSEVQKTESVQDGVDLALATKLQKDETTPVANDFYLDNPERIFVVSGPNQGGKTTFARMFGQLHYFGSLGLPVAAKSAHLFLADRIFTHFERTERMASLRGKLQDDLIRIHDILSAATGKSIVIINEIFASTTLEDATFLSHRIGEAIIALDCLCVWVTFIEEISALSETTVSMVSAVAPDNPERRTFKLLRQPVDGLAHAMTIARKYHLTADAIRARIGA